MSLPSFPGDGDRTHRSSPLPTLTAGLSPGAGNKLPVWLLALCGAFTAVGECYACYSLLCGAARCAMETGLRYLASKNIRRADLT